MSRVPRRSSGLASFIATPRNSTYILEFAECQHFPASGEANGDRCRDSERFISTCNDLQGHGRYPKSLQDSLRRRYCVPRCVPRIGSNQSALTLRRASKRFGAFSIYAARLFSLLNLDISCTSYEHYIG